MPNAASVISTHNKKVLNNNNNNNPVITPGCNPVIEASALYLETVWTKVWYIVMIKLTINKENGKNYIGVTENTWKDRNYKHRNSYKDPTKKYDIGLSKYIWDLKGKGIKMEDIMFELSIIDHATPYINGTLKCNLCLTAKSHIIKTSLELINKGRNSFQNVVTRINSI